MIAASLEATQCAYYAGIFDGEGSISIITHRRAASTQMCLQARVINTNRPLVESLSVAFGGYISTRPAKGRQRTCYAWGVQGASAVDVLMTLRPYLRIKLQQADLAIRFQQYLTLNSHYPPTEAMIQVREAMRERMSQLNAGIAPDQPLDLPTPEQLAASRLPEGVMFVLQAATTFDIQRKTLYRAIKDGRLPTQRIGKMLAVRSEDIASYQSTLR